jgi:hypothetical protein
LAMPPLLRRVRTSTSLRVPGMVREVVKVFYAAAPSSMPSLPYQPRARL